MQESAPKKLGTGFLAATTGVIFTCPKFTKIEITDITLVNTHTGAEVVNIHMIVAGGTAKGVTPKDLSIAVGAMATGIGVGQVLEYGDVINGDATDASKVSYIITGKEVRE